MNNSAVDERIVEMQFNNEDFESGVSKSLTTLDKLKESLSFSNLKDGFSNIQNGIAGLNFAPIEDGLYGLQEGFGMVEMVGLRAMQRIADAAIDMGTKLVNAVTIDPIKSGLQEYETQIGAVQTIMANTEEAFKDVDEQTHLDAVNDALDELNTYADKTIYNFTEMTRNIGTFTAAGVSLEQSKTAIQGIANMAAVSGSTSQQASSAMYQLSQALASGTVKLQDWNSVVSAGMGGEVFKNALEQSSKALVVANEKVQALAASGKDANAIAAETGIELSRVEKLMKDGYVTSYDAAIEKHGTFRDSMSEGWITSEVLIDALRNATLNLDDMTEEEQKAARATLEANGYTEEQIEDIFRLGKSATEAATKVKTFSQLIDTTKEALQSGWTQSWEYIIGDFGEAKEFWTDISDYLGKMINDSANARNAVLEQWHDNGGRTTIIEGLKLSFQALVSYVSTAKDIFSGFIPKVTADTLINFSNAVLNLGKNLQPTAEQLNVFKMRLERFSQPLNVIRDFLLSFKPWLDPIKESLSGVGLVVESVVVRAGIFVDFISGMLRVAHVPGKAAELISKGIMTIGDTISNVYGKIKEFIGALTGLDIDFFKSENGNWAEAGKALESFLNGLEEGIVKTKDKIKDFFGTLVDSFSVITGIDFRNLVTWENFLGVVRDFGEQLRGIPERITNFKESISTGFTGILGSINALTGLDLHIPTWEEFKATMLSIAETIKGWKTNFDTARTAIGGFFTEVYNRLEPVRTAFGNAKDAVLGFFGSFKKDSDTEAGLGILESLAKVGNVLKDIFEKAYSVVSTAVRNIWIKLKELKDKVNFQDIFKGLLGGAGVVGLLNFSYLTDTLTKTLKGENNPLSFLKMFTEGLKEAMETFKEIMEPFGDTLAAFQNKLKADMLKNIALAVAILVGSLVAISLVDSDKLLTSIAAIGALMGELVLAVSQFEKATEDDDGKKFTTLSMGILKLSIGVGILAGALTALGGLEPNQLLGGLVAIGSMMLMLYALIENFSNLKDFDPKAFSKTASGFVVLAIGIRILSGAVKSLGELSLGQLGKGLIGVATLIGALGLFTKFAEAENMKVGSGVGLLLLAGAIRVLAGAVMSFKDSSWESIAKGLVAVSGILLGLGLFTKFAEVDNMGIGSGVGLLLLGKAIEILANAMLPFKDLKWEEIAKGLVAIAGLLLSVGVALKLMPDNMVAVGLGIMAVAGAILMMKSALMDIGQNMEWEEIGKGLAAIAGGLFTMALAGAAMADSVAGAAAIMVMAIAINVFVPALKALGDMEWSEIGKGLAALAGVFVILGVAGYALSPVVPVILALAGALALIGAATALAGVGMVAMGAGLTVIQNFAAILNSLNMTILLEFFKNLLGAIAELLPGFVGLISEILQAIIAAIAQNGVAIVQAVVAIGSAVLDALLVLGPKLITTGLALLMCLLQGINSNIYQIILVGASILVNFMNGMALVAPTLMEAGVNLIISLLDGMAQALVENVDRLINAMENVMNAMLYTLLALIQNAVEHIPVVGGQISDGIEGIKEDIKAKMSFDEGKQVTNDLMDGISAGVEEKTPDTKTTVDGLIDTVNEGLANIDANSLTDAISAGVVGGIANSQGDAEDAANVLGAGVTNVLGAADTAKSGSDMVANLKEAIEGGTPDITSVAEALGGGAVEAFASADGESAGSDLVDKIVSGIDDSNDKVQDAGETAGGAGVEGVNATYDDYYNSGGYIMGGAAQGIYDNVYQVTDAATYAGNKAHAAYDNASGVSSPSWKFARSGMFQMLGGANGIRDNVGLLTNAASYAGNETVDAFSESISDMSDYADLGIDDAPSIRPVMDLGGIQNGIGELNSMLSKDMARSVTVGTNRVDRVGYALDGLTDLTGKSNGDIVSILQRQIEMTGMLIDAINNQKLWLDRTKVVGGIINDIDNALGQKAIIAGRRG